MEKLKKQHKEFLREIGIGLENMEPHTEEEEQIVKDLLAAVDYFEKAIEVDEMTKDFLTMLGWAFKLGATHNALMVASSATVLVVASDEDTLADITNALGEKDEQVH